MQPETKQCANCQTSFTILPEDFEFYERLKVNPPSICPRCGLQKVMSWRNERNLYTRKCDKCGKAGLSIYHPQAPYVVYCHDCWWKDDWSGKDYAMDYDPSRPLMDQFRELQSRVPRESMVIINSTNSDYGNQIRDSKDIYFCFLISLTENALYSMWITNGPKDVLDCHKVVGGERVAHCVDVSKCSGCAYLQDSTDSVDCYFSYGLKGCNNCLFSSNLRKKTNYVRNQQVTKEEFLAEKNKVLSGSWSSLKKAIAEYQGVKDKALRRFAEITKSSSVAGNYIEACGSCRFAFEGVNAEHCLAAISLINPKEAYYSYSVGNQPAEYVYGSCIIKGGSNVRFCFNLFTSNDVVLCDSLISCSNCIASVGLKHGEYSILNKEYSKEEYLKIQDELFKKGELSDFPSPAFSTFAYNETAAGDYYRVTEEEAVSKGYRWQHDTTKTTGKETMTPENVPDNIKYVNEEILKEILRCVRCDRNYRIVKVELDMLKSFGLPLPRECPFCRMAARRAERRPYELYTRPCAKCGSEMQTSYSPDRPEVVYCEQCYQQEVI